MNRHLVRIGVMSIFAAVLLAGGKSQAGLFDSFFASAPKKEPWLSPTALAATSDGKTLFIACATTFDVRVFDTATGKVTRTIEMPESPLGLVLSADGAKL